MLKYYLILVFSLYSATLHAQGNIVPNPSFELHSNCPSNYGQITYASKWFQPFLGGSSTDYFNSCAPVPNFSVPANGVGSQQAKTGTAYAGIFSYLSSVSIKNYREYLEIQLQDLLIQGETYCVSFYVSNPEKPAYASDGIGAYFSNLPVLYASPLFGVLSLIPQIQNPSGNIISDTVNWIKIQNSFIATGGERYITIGNFRNDSLTVLATVNATSLAHYAYFYIDDVSVMPGSCNVGIQEINNEDDMLMAYPNPTHGIIQLKNNDDAFIEVLDAVGRLMFTVRNSNTINLENFENGIYIIKKRMTNGKVSHCRLILNK